MSGQHYISYIRQVLAPDTLTFYRTRI